MDLSSYLKCIFTLLDGRLRDWTMIAVLRDDMAVVQRLAQELVEYLEVEQIKNHKQMQTSSNPNLVVLLCFVNKLALPKRGN